MVNRHQNRNRPIIPRSLQECIVMEPHDKTFNHEQFLQYDSGIGDLNRILIFTINEELLLLGRSTVFLADGIFKTVPQIIFQLYTIHYIIGNLDFSLVYYNDNDPTVRNNIRNNGYTIRASG